MMWYESGFNLFFAFFFHSSAYSLQGHRGAKMHLKINFQLRTYGFTSGTFVSSLMSDVELGNDKRRIKKAGRMETSWVGVCISLPLSTQVELQWVGVFLLQKRRRARERDRPGDGETCGGRVAESVRQVKERREGR